MSLCRLLRAPAGSRPFPTLSLRIFLYVQGPLPRLLLWCIHPFLPTRLRPSQRRHPVGALAEIHALATSAWGTFRGCSHSLIFKPVDLLATPIAPTVTPLDIRQPWLLRPRLSQFVTSLSRGYANRLNRAIGGRGTSTLLDSQPCRLLRRPSPQNRLANATAYCAPAALRPCRFATPSLARRWLRSTPTNGSTALGCGLQHGLWRASARRPCLTRLAPSGDYRPRASPFHGQQRTN